MSVQINVDRRLWFDAKLKWYPTGEWDDVTDHELWFDAKLKWYPTKLNFRLNKSGCGLMQNWNDIQLRSLNLLNRRCCGLMQNWNDIQLSELFTIKHLVVVWCKIEMISNNYDFSDWSGTLWFDAKLKWYPTYNNRTINSKCCGLMQNWNDIQRRFCSFNPVNSCGLMQNWNDIQQNLTNVSSWDCCGLMQNWNDIQLHPFHISLCHGCGLMQNWNDIQLGRNNY